MLVYTARVRVDETDFLVAGYKDFDTDLIKPGTRREGLAI